MNFQLADGTEAGEIVMENERLKATLQILNQKLSVYTDQQNIIDRLKEENTA